MQKRGLLEMWGEKEEKEGMKEWGSEDHSLWLSPLLLLTASNIPEPIELESTGSMFKLTSKMVLDEGRRGDEVPQKSQNASGSWKPR